MLQKIAKKSKKKTISKVNAGKLMLDLGKLIFGSVFLGGVLRGEILQSILVIGGFAIAVIFCLVGLKWVNRE